MVARISTVVNHMVKVKVNMAVKANTAVNVNIRIRIKITVMVPIRVKVKIKDDIKAKDKDSIKAKFKNRDTTAMPEITTKINIIKDTTVVVRDYLPRDLLKDITLRTSTPLPPSSSSCSPWCLL
jgi:hypothetical protein